MLKSFFLSFEFSRFCQSGFYFDFFYKKLSEVFVRNVFVYAAQFIGEKYLIETITKKVFDNAIFKFNKLVAFRKLNHNFFFVNFILILSYCLILINIFYLFL